MDKPGLVAEFTTCDHGVAFDEKAAEGLTAFEIRQRWPRYVGECQKGCGAIGMMYASWEHYIAGDW